MPAPFGRGRRDRVRPRDRARVRGPTGRSGSSASTRRHRTAAATPATSRCATRATAAPRSRTAPTRPRAAPARWRPGCGCCSSGASPSRACRPWSGGPTSATGPRASWPGGSASASTACCATRTCRAVSSSTPGSARCWPTSRASRRGRWLTAPVLEGGGVRLRPLDRASTCRGSSRRAPTSAPSTGWAGCPSPYTRPTRARGSSGNIEGQATGRPGHLGGRRPRPPTCCSGRSTSSTSTEHDCEVGYWAHPDARGRGVMRAAMPLVVRWAFAELGVRRRARWWPRSTTRRHATSSRRPGCTQTGSERLGTVLRTGLADVALYDVLAPRSGRAR